MSTRPIRRIFPNAKLTADNAGDIELSSHRRAIAATVAAPQHQSTPSLPHSGPPDPVKPTPATAVGTTPPKLVPAHTSATTKRPRAHPLMQATSFSSIQTIPDDHVDSDKAPKAKKSKVTSHQVGPTLQSDVSIIEINDSNDQQVKPLNKISPTADVKAFFTEVSHVPGQNKGCMKCNLCM